MRLPTFSAMFRFPSSLLTLLVCVSTLMAQTPELIVPTGHARALLHLETSPSGGWLASTSIDETVKIWDAAAGRELHTFRPGKMARDLAFSHDERYLAVAAFNEIHLLETTGWTTVRGIKGWWTNGVAFHPQRAELYYFTQRSNSTGEDPIQVYALSLPDGSPRRLATVERASGKVVANLDLSPDGSQLLLVQGTTAHLIPTGGGAPRLVLGSRRFTPNGELFFVTTAGNNGTFGVKSTDGQTRWELQAPADQVQNPDLVHTMGFVGNRFYWANQPDRIAHGDVSTGNPAMYEMPPGTDRTIAAGADGTLYFTNKTDRLVRAAYPPALLTPRMLGERVLSPYQLAGSKSPAQLSWGQTEITTMRFVDGQLLPYGGPDGRHGSGQLKYANDGSLLTAAAATGDVFSYRAPGRHAEVKRFKSGYLTAEGTAVNGDGEWLAVVARDGYLLMNTRSDKSSTKGVPGPGYSHFWGDAALSPKGGLLLLNAAKKLPGGSKTETHARLVKLSTGESLWEVPGWWEAPRFSADGSRIAAEIYQHLATYNPADGRELSRHPLPQGRFPTQTRFNGDLSWACYTHNERAYAYDLTANREYEMTVPGQRVLFERGAFFADDFVAFAGREGKLWIFDLRTRAVVATLVRYADSDDWALVAPDGRFEATPGAMKKMYYRVGNQRVALEQLFDGYYQPGLANEIFNRLPRGSAPAPLGSLRPAPSVEISYLPVNTRGLIVEDDEGPKANLVRARTQDAVLVVAGNAPADRITELRLYRNDKRIADGQRGLVVEDDEDPPTNGERRYRVRLLPGTNAFRAVALNSQRTESKAAYLTVEYVPAPAASVPNPAPAPAPTAGFSGPAGTTLHLVTVGIDRYANPEYNLNYATADADALRRRLDAKTRALVGKVREHTVRNDGATRDGILTQLRAVASQADADDVLVFYFAGHGLVPDRSSGEFYLLPHEIDAASTAARQGISATALRNLSTAVAAERQLFVLDACQSGGAENALRAAEEKAIAGLARSTGTHWLTATDSEQLATEFSTLGHGAFTFTLLEGLSGKADTGNDGVSVSELKTYLERQLPELTRRYGGRPQFPRSFGYGRDFRVVR